MNTAKKTPTAANLVKGMLTARGAEMRAKEETLRQVLTHLAAQAEAVAPILRAIADADVKQAPNEGEDANEWKVMRADGLNDHLSSYRLTMIQNAWTTVDRRWAANGFDDNEPFSPSGFDDSGEAGQMCLDLVCRLTSTVADDVLAADMDEKHPV